MVKMRLKAYAQKHKQSMFHVMKMAKQGSLPTLTEIEEGKEVLYILEEENADTSKEDKKFTSDKRSPVSVEEQIKELQKEVVRLKDMILNLQKEIATIHKG